MFGAGKIAARVSTIVILIAASVLHGQADEQRSIFPEPANRSGSAPATFSLIDLGLSLSRLTDRLAESRIVLPPRPRISRSHRPMRQITLVGGDQFVGELLDWGTQSAEFRLQTGQTVSVPVAAISRLANSPGESDVLHDSFESNSLVAVDGPSEKSLDDTQSASGQSSLRIDSSHPTYRQSIEPPLASLRLEFAFKVANNELATACGDWKIEWDHPAAEPFVIRVASDGTVSLAQRLHGSDSSSQALKISENWHSFVALITPDRTRLIIDNSILATGATPKAAVKAVTFRAADPNSTNVLWIDELQVRKTGPIGNLNSAPSLSIDRDWLSTSAGDELFGKIISLMDNSVTLETLGKARSIPLSRITSLNWYQPASTIRQTVSPKSGVVARIAMQPFADRPQCDPEEFTVTIQSVDAKRLVVQHSLLGEMTIPWSAVQRIEPQFFGRSLLIDARRFHLGNSIRTDFRRHLPDGTKLSGEFVLAEDFAGQAFFSFDIAELEAAGAKAPPGSPYLAELRAGNLLTEVFLNDHSLGQLNEHLRYKSKIQNPDRIRLKIPPDVLKRGQNTYQFRQLPLKKGGREFDDAEVGNFRIDFKPEK